MARYFGRICDLHPELKGERMVSNRKCFKCLRIQHHKRIKERRKLIRRRARYFGKVCEKHPELNGERYERDSCCVECTLIRQKIWNSKPHRKIQQQAYRFKNKVRIIARAKAYRSAHRAEQNAIEREKWKTDPQFRLVRNLRLRLKRTLWRARTTKSQRTFELIGCSVLFLMQHLEQQFTSGMNWANQGKWHIDHIKPIASFDLVDLKQQRECFHYTNLQPLWGKDNSSKGIKSMEEWKKHGTIHSAIC